MARRQLQRAHTTMKGELRIRRTTSKKLLRHSKGQNSALGFDMERLTRLCGTGVPYPAAPHSQSVVQCSGSEDPSNYTGHNCRATLLMGRRTPNKQQSIEKKLRCVKSLSTPPEENLHLPGLLAPSVLTGHRHWVARKVAPALGLSHCLSRGLRLS